MRRLRNITQKKEWDQFTTGNVKETAISNMSGRKIKVMIIKILTGLKRRAEEFSETSTNEIENIKTNRVEEHNNCN